MSKFESIMAEEFYFKTLDSQHSEELGDVHGFNYYALFRKDMVILTENSDGFVTLKQYDDPEPLENAWESIESDYAEWLDEYNNDYELYEESYETEEYFDMYPDSDLWDEF
jgi:hypothetical protein